MKIFVFLILGFLIRFFESDNLPNVLIIGDSISIGYTPYVQKALKERANVFRNPGNAGHTGMGLESLDLWLGDTKWDIIHFNWGLWDLCYRSPESTVQGGRDKVNGTVTFSIEEYGNNLEELVLRLQKTGAILIFANTTFVPRGEAGRIFKDDKRYNKVAEEIMRKHGVQINNLNRVSRNVHKKHGKAPDDVHYTSLGSKLMSEPVIEIILKNLIKTL